MEVQEKAPEEVQDKKEEQEQMVGANQYFCDPDYPDELSTMIMKATIKWIMSSIAECCLNT